MERFTAKQALDEFKINEEVVVKSQTEELLKFCYDEIKRQSKSSRVVTIDLREGYEGSVNIKDLHQLSIERVMTELRKDEYKAKFINIDDYEYSRFTKEIEIRF